MHVNDSDGIMPDECNGDVINNSKRSYDKCASKEVDPVQGTLQEVSRRLYRLTDGNSPQNIISDDSTDSSLTSSIFSPDMFTHQNGFAQRSCHSMKDLSRTANDWKNSSRRPLLSSATPNSLPPPFQRNISCTSLRTAYESDSLPSNFQHSPNSASTFSNKSVLPPITIQDARTRSFIVGNVWSKGSLLGPEELIRYFPSKRVRIFVGTWNMNGQDAPPNLEDFLLPESVGHMADVYIVAVQEGLQDRQEWNVTLQTCLGPSHVLFHAASLGVLHLSVFMRRDLVWFCSVAEEDGISTRPGTMIKTKGAVAISYICFGTSFLFINSHLTAHARKLQERIVDYEKICQMINLPKKVPPTIRLSHSKDVSTKFDCVFWCGDLNFRLDHDRSTVLRLVEDVVQSSVATFDHLLQHDQLRKAMSTGVAFHGFQEAKITFAPSYKFASGSTQFDSIKQRVPSYTDRILFRARNVDSIQCLQYSMALGVASSDHKPVFAVFEVQVQPGRDNIPLAAGLFDRNVYLQAMTRRAELLEARNAQERGSLVCSLM